LKIKLKIIERNGYTTSISNTVNVSHVTGFKAEDVVYQKIISIVLGGDNGINMNSGMLANQSGTDSVILLAGDNTELLSLFNGFVKKIKFTTTYNENNRGNIIILATEYIDMNNKYFETDTITILETIRPFYTYEFDVNVTIKSGDQVFVGYNTGSTNSEKFNVTGMNNILQMLHIIGVFQEQRGM
jgi:hypothetical protein